MKIEIEIKDGINPITALRAIEQVIAGGKVSRGENDKPYYCWATTFDTVVGEIVVLTRQYRKNECFLVQKHFRLTKRESSTQ